MNFNSVIKNFLANHSDTTGNTFKVHRPVSERLAREHHFLRLLNVILPNMMPWSKFGMHNGITKVDPNHIAMSAIGDIIEGTIWLNTEFESNCVMTRLKLLENYGVTVETSVRTHGSTRNPNYIVSVILNLGKNVKPTSIKVEVDGGSTKEVYIHEVEVEVEVQKQPKNL